MVWHAVLCSLPCMPSRTIHAVAASVCSMQATDDSYPDALWQHACWQHERGSIHADSMSVAVCTLIVWYVAMQYSAICHNGAYLDSADLLPAMAPLPWAPLPCMCPAVHLNTECELAQPPLTCTEQFRGVELLQMQCHG